MDRVRKRTNRNFWLVLPIIHSSLKPDSELDIKQYTNLLKRVEKTIHTSPNRVRYNMNGFIIAIGSYIVKLNKQALEIAHKIGKVTVYMGDTSCKVPYAPDYIKKVMDKGKLGAKRKKARC